MDRIIRQSEASIPTYWGEFAMRTYASHADDRLPQLALISSAWKADPSGVPLVRLHSECLTGDIFHSMRCDCGRQLHQSMQLLADEKGALIYLRQEGRGIGIINKLRAYNKQDEGMNTVEANQALGLEADSRTYEKAVEILRDLCMQRIDLITNNPDKIGALKKQGIDVRRRIPLLIEPNAQNYHYLLTKQNVMGHLLDLR